jgi:hypothetical protein
MMMWHRAVFPQQSHQKTNLRMSTCDEYAIKTLRYLDGTSKNTNSKTSVSTWSVAPLADLI